MVGHRRLDNVRACVEEVLENGVPGDFIETGAWRGGTAIFMRALLKAHGVAISMDGRGRALDNIFVERLWRSVKHEDVYLRGYGSLPELLVGLTNYFGFYNAERSHQSLGYRTPDEVYRTAVGGGARIVDKFGGKKAAPSKSAEAESGQRRSAASDPLPS